VTDDHLGPLAALPDPERRALAGVARPVRLAGGDYAHHEGEPGRTLSILRSGRVGVWSGGLEGRPTLVGTLGPGDVVGESAVLRSERVRSATVQALTDVEALELDAADVQGVLARRPRAHVLFIDLLVARIERLNARLAEFVELDGATRLNRQLCVLGEVEPGGRRATTIPLAQHHLASLAGVSLRLASDVLGDARRDGLVRTGRGRVEVLDWPGVERRAGLRG
jgi:CRP-like cAMP-binding protein